MKAGAWDAATEPYSAAEAASPGPVTGLLHKAIYCPRSRASLAVLAVEIEDPIHGKARVPGIPVQLSETPGKVERLAPRLGSTYQRSAYGIVWLNLG